MKLVDPNPKMMAAVLRRLADALDDGKAHITDIVVSNDMDLVALPSEPHEHQRHDMVFRGQRISIAATSMRNLFEAEVVK